MSGVPPWDRWKELTPDQQSYEKHRLMEELFELVKEQHTTCCTQIASCSERLKRHRNDINEIKETHKKLKWIAGVMGLGGLGTGASTAKFWPFIKDLFK